MTATLTYTVTTHEYSDDYTSTLQVTSWDELFEEIKELERCQSSIIRVTKVVVE